MIDIIWPFKYPIYKVSLKIAIPNISFLRELIPLHKYCYDFDEIKESIFGYISIFFSSDFN